MLYTSSVIFCGWTPRTWEHQSNKVSFRNFHFFLLLFQFHFLSLFPFTSFTASEEEDIVLPVRYYPESLSSLCKATRFSEDEIKRMYRSFKSQCPTGFICEDTFKEIYSQFFPFGGESHLFELNKFPSAHMQNRASTFLPFIMANKCNVILFDCPNCWVFWVEKFAI